MYSIARTPKILTSMSKTGECRQQEHTQHAPSTKTECDYLYGWIKKGSYTHISLSLSLSRSRARTPPPPHTHTHTHNGEPQSYIAGNAGEEQDAERTLQAAPERQSGLQHQHPEVTEHGSGRCRLASPVTGGRCAVLTPSCPWHQWCFAN